MTSPHPTFQIYNPKGFKYSYIIWETALEFFFRGLFCLSFYHCLPSSLSLCSALSLFCTFSRTVLKPKRGFSIVFSTGCKHILITFYIEHFKILCSEITMSSRDSPTWGRFLFFPMHISAMEIWGNKDCSVDWLTSLNKCFHKIL